MLPLIYTNAVAAAIFLAACLIWNVPEMIGTIKQTARVSRKEASVQDRGSVGHAHGLAVDVQVDQATGRIEGNDAHAAPSPNSPRVEIADCTAPAAV